MSRCTSPDKMRSATCGRPSDTFFTGSAGTPFAVRCRAVPDVANMRKPISWNRRTIGVTVCLSESLTDTKTAPLSGNSAAAPLCALANAIPKLSAIPITSPVDSISGPSSVSTPGNLVNGKTASFTATYGAGVTSTTPNCSSVCPTITAAASLASGTPVALLTNGTVRELRGLTSRTYTTPSLMAYCTLMRPTTPSALANSLV